MNNIDLTLSFNVKAAIQQQLNECGQDKPFSVSPNHTLPKVIPLFKQHINPLGEGAAMEADATVFLEGSTIDPIDAEGYMVGIGSCIGCEEEMQNVTLIKRIHFNTQEASHFCDLFALFDGDQTSQASQFAAQNLSLNLQQALEDYNVEEKTPEGIFDGITAGFRNTHTSYNELGGTEGIAACIEGESIWIANAGTSRAFFVTATDTVQASEDALPATPRYVNEITRLDGQIILTSDGEKVNDILSTARGIGYKHIKGFTGKCCILPDPVMGLYPKKTFKGGYLVLASHSLFRTATVNELGQAIREMAKQGIEPEEMGKRIVAEAISRYPDENMTIMIIRL